MYDTSIANRLRLRGLKVVEIAGWQTRGSSSFNPRGSVDHHTAGGATGNAPSLNVCIYGRSDLPGPLCQVLIGRDNTCYVIAAGRANHAGSGGWRGLSGNSSVFGIERENSGREAWRPDQTFVAAVAHAALIDGRIPSNMVCGHKEWTTRKPDPHTLNMNDFRSLIQDILNVWANPVVAPPPPQPMQPSTAPSDAAVFLAKIAEAARAKPTLRLGSRGSSVSDMQNLLNGSVGQPVLSLDGVFGLETERWVKQYQRDRQLSADGVVGFNTWAHLLAEVFARLGGA